MSSERFWTKVDMTGRCWVWTKYLDPDGYGTFWIERGKTVFAHRHALTLLGINVDGREVDHRCHNHACVRPSHLRLATRKQNAEHLIGATSRSETGVRGVFWDRCRWVANVKHNGKNYRKRFKNYDEACAYVIQLRNELFTHNDLDKVT